MNKTTTPGNMDIWSALGKTDPAHTKQFWTRTSIDREKVCKLISPAVPAVYDCAPLLSEDEEAKLV